MMFDFTFNMFALYTDGEHEENGLEDHHFPEEDRIVAVLSQHQMQNLGNY